MAMAMAMTMMTMMMRMRRIMMMMIVVVVVMTLMVVVVTMMIFIMTMVFAILRVLMRMIIITIAIIIGPRGNEPTSPPSQPTRLQTARLQPMMITKMTVYLRPGCHQAMARGPADGREPSGAIACILRRRSSPCRRR